ncbi:ABC transporter ATP-binding protein, partial [Pedobacter sp. HMWF019]|uniref:ABC transporter transmembrane domain-containing protein n=1 Tax=Pedobacter sp. HMWF019 TaxID=2056856 RepID=UPI000D412238
MKKIKSTLKSRFGHLAYFYSYLREKVFIAIVLNIIVGFLDGLGLSMFLPLLQVADGTGQANASSMGHLGFLVSFLQKAGLVVTMQLALIVIVVFFVLKGVVYYIKGVYQVKLQQYFIREIRLKSIQHLSNLSYTHFVKSDLGNIQNALTGEVDKVSKACQFYFQAFQHGVLVLVYIGFAFAVDWKFAIMVSIGGLFSDLVYRKIYKKTKEVSKKLSEDNGAFQGLIQEFVSCFKYLKATAGIKQYQKKLIDQVDVIEKNNSRIGVLSVVLSATREPLSIIVVAVVIFLQTTIFHTYLTAILISLLFFYRALGSLMQFQVSWNSFLGLAGSIEHLEAFSQELAAGRELYMGKE